MSLRYITKQQFSDGTTIDGNRLEDAIQSLEELSDKAPYGSVKTRFTQSQLVSGWSPILDPVSDRSGPFLPIVNTAPPLLEPELFKAIRNNFRYKGTDANIRGMDTLAWDVSTQFDHPVILHALDYILQQGSTADPTYQFPGIAAPYDPPLVSDIEVHVYVDSEYVPSDRTQSDMEIHKQNFSTDAWKIVSTPTLVPPVSDMLPPYPGGSLTGWAVSIKDLNIPVRAFGRIRMIMLIPDKIGSVPEWGVKPWRNMAPTLTATFLEPLRHG